MVTSETVDATGNRRAYAIALLLLIAGSGLLLVAYGLTWGTAEVPLLAGSDSAVRTQELTGRDLYPAAAMAGWIGLAAVAGIVATRSWGRTIVAVVGALAGLAGAGAALAFGLGASSAIDTGVSGHLGVATSVASQSGGAWLLALVGGLAVLVASGWTAVRGRTWPAMGRRYERTAAGRRQLSDWEAQDVGQDPTDDLVE
jgi:uncharacterized membrane protein (TIGR02234 family)